MFYLYSYHSIDYSNESVLNSVSVKNAGHNCITCYRPVKINATSKATPWCYDSSGSPFSFYRLFHAFSVSLSAPVLSVSLSLPALSSLLPFNSLHKSRNWTWECLLAASSCTPNRHVPIHREEQNSVIASWSWHAWQYESFLNWTILFTWSYCWNSLTMPCIFCLLDHWCLEVIPQVKLFASLCVSVNVFRRLSIITVALSTSWLTASCFPLCFLPSEVARGVSAALHYWSLQ